MLNAITSQDLNQVQLSTYGELTTAMRHEHRAHQHVQNSMFLQSLAQGFNNISTIYRPDLLIAQLIHEGILPDTAELGRQKFCDLGHLQRTALSAPVSYLMEKEEEIKQWVEDHTPYNPNDVFNVLIGGAMIGASLGVVPLASPTQAKLYSRVNALPDSHTKIKVLRDKDRILKLLSAD